MIKGIILAFIICQLINVILATVRSILTIKGTKLSASVSTAISYAVGSVVTKLITGIDSFVIIASVTFVANIIGVYLGLWLIDKMRKDQIWKISALVPTENVKQLKIELNGKGVNFVAYETSWEYYKVFDIFSESKKESKIVKETISKYNIKYTIMANNIVL